MQHHDRTLRIIGGNWRGRKITFPQIDVIRPTSDRVRETLFNWLMHDINGARCLDLFAGSGALGIEALSRGAESVTLVEQDKKIAASIEDNLEKLGAANNAWRVEVNDAYQWIKNQDTPYDIVFLDPPFGDDKLAELITLLTTQGIAHRYLYVETAQALESGVLPGGWEILRQKRAGAVHYALCGAISD